MHGTLHNPFMEEPRMKASRWLIATVAGMFGFVGAGTPSECFAQAATKEAAANPPVMIVSIYRITPGKQLDFLKYMAQLDAVAKEAGLRAQQFYAHLDGDSWDYVTIRQATTEAEDSRLDAISRKHGLATGFAAGLQIRQFVSSHTDTYSRGPTTAADLVAAAVRK
jgi:membrane-bound lytic murein transglycosylase B